MALELGTSWVISSVRTSPGGNVSYEVVTNSLQRLYVTVPRSFTTDDERDTIIEQALAGLIKPGKPLA